VKLESAIETREGRGDWALVALLTLVGMGLRLAYMLQVPPFLDEYSSMLTGISILREAGIPRLPSGVLYTAGSLFSYLEAAFIGLFGFSDAVARLPSLLVGGLTLPAVYIVARNMLNRRAALVGMALLATAPEAVVWGGRARMYSLLQLMTVLAVYYFYRSVLDTDPGRDARPMPAWPWVLCFTAAIFTQDEAILLLPIFWFAALVGRGWRWFLQPGVFLGQVFLPLAGVGARIWLYQIRVPGEVISIAKDAYFSFPPALANGLKEVAPFFFAPWAWPATILFCVALVLLVWQGSRDKGRGAEDGEHTSRRTLPVLRFTPPAFVMYVFLAFLASMVLAVNAPWQDDRYMFLVQPLFLVLAGWGLDQLLGMLSRCWPALESQWATIALVVVVVGVTLPGGLSALDRFEPDYSAAYDWLASQLADKDLVTTVRPAPASVYLGRCDFLVAEADHEEFIMRFNGEWLDRWAGASVIESPEAFRDQVLETGRWVWFVIDEDRFESTAYSPEFVALILGEMELVWHEGGVLVFRGQGYHPPPEMAVTRALDANFADQVRLTGYALSTDRPEPGQEVILQLFWQAIRPERNYTVFVHVVGVDGQGLTQLDEEPFLGLYGMSTHWPRDRAVTDERRLALPVDTPPGRYRREVGLYDAGNPEAEPLALAGTGERSVTLDFLHVAVAPPSEPPQPVSEGNLGGVVRLVGYDLPQTTVAAGAILPLTLTWECLATFEADYTVFVHLVGDEGPPLAQADSQPLAGTYPTRFWDVGEWLADPYVVEVPVGVPPGQYELRVGMYLLATGERLPLLGVDGQVLGDSISLDRVAVTSP
jgi:4-amino-4-deoxy-L-arabinose transferase-like glycosyltransferase